MKHFQGISVALLATLALGPSLATADPLLPDVKEVKRTSQWIFGVGYHLGYTQLGSGRTSASGSSNGTTTTESRTYSDGYHLAHGPIGNVKYMMDNEGSFLFFEGTAGVLLGLNETAFTVAGGLGVGGRAKAGWGIWVGADYFLMPGYSIASASPGGAARFKLGGFLPPDETNTSRLDFSLHYTSIPIDAVTKIYHFSYVALEVIYSFL